MTTAEFPSPAINDDMAPFFAASAEQRFVIMRCRDCGAWYWPYTGCRNHPNAPYLANMEWTEASGRGNVFSFTIARLQFHAAFPTPYVYALVELAEGPLMPGNIIGCAPEEVRVGLPVQVELRKAPNGLVLPAFRAA